MQHPEFVSRLPLGLLSKNIVNGIGLIGLIVNLEGNSAIKQQHLEGEHSYIDSTYMEGVGEACTAEAKNLGRIQDARFTGWSFCYY